MKAVTFNARNESGVRSLHVAAPRPENSWYSSRSAGSATSLMKSWRKIVTPGASPLCRAMNIPVLSVMSGLVCASFHLASVFLIPNSSMARQCGVNAQVLAVKKQALFIFSRTMFSSHLEKQLVCTERRCS